MKDATLVSVALFALATHAFQMDLYYRNKGRFREKRYIAYADLSVSEEHHLVARISFGTPAQEFCVVLDTSQDTSWLISSSVSNFWDGKRKFDMAASQAREQFGVTIGPRRVRGQGVKDMFQLDGYPVGRLTFSMFTAYNPNARIPGSGDGYLGLGYPDIERTIPDHNVLDVMMANGMIDYKRFTLFCVCATHRNNLEPDARIVFGSHGTINPQEFHMVPLENAHGGWRVHVESLRTPLRGIFHRRFVASLDSTSWLNKIAVDRAGLINTALGATLHGELYIVNCDGLAQLPNLIFGLQGVDLTLTPQQYILREEAQGGTRCFSSIVPDPEILSASIVLGMSFMEHFITIFDQQSKRVGFKSRVC